MSTPDPISHEVLRDIEWINPSVGGYEDGPFCPSCKAQKDWPPGSDHAPGCVLAAALATPSGDEVAELRAERDDYRTKRDALRAEFTRLNEDFSTLRDRAAAAEAQRDALQAENARLREALEPFVIYADAALQDGMEGEFGEVYKDGFRISIHTRDLRRARSALTPHQQGDGARQSPAQDGEGSR